jgi:hypothetical protein
MKEIVKKAFLLILLILSLGVSTPAIAQPIVINEQKVIYNLPYPGILPDNPLYIFKIIRDRAREITTRDYLKKADLYLLFSDKRAAMALALVDNGKDKLAVSTLSKAEKYFEKIPDILKTSKKQGVSPSSDAVNRLKLSNSKHREIAQDLLKKLPQGQDDAINQILNLNDKIRALLEKL